MQTECAHDLDALACTRLARHKIFHICLISRVTTVDAADMPVHTWQILITGKPAPSEPYAGKKKKKKKKNVGRLVSQI